MYDAKLNVEAGVGLPNASCLLTNAKCHIAALRVKCVTSAFVVISKELSRS